ncbi:MAG: zinc ribbon domain-containing protein [Victivallaceae bacterium]|nr:zinc ribbon domain-containing protein [Victivallaceae bacterium]
MAENFYLLLGLSLDPKIEDPKQLLKAIEQKEIEWNNSRTNSVGPDTLRYTQYGEMIPEIKSRLAGSDATSRQEIILEAESICQAKLLELMEGLSAKGYLTESDIARICKEVPQYSEKSIRKKITVPVKENSKPQIVAPPKPAPPPVSPQTLEIMTKDMPAWEKLLNLVGKETMYDFLDCTPLSREQTLLASVKAIQSKTPPAKKTARYSAEVELAGKIATYLKKTDAKSVYDLVLKDYQAKNKLGKIFALRIDTGTPKVKRILRSDYLASIKEALAIGMTKMEAEYFVYDFYISTRKCEYPIPAENEKPFKPILFCRACLTANDDHADVCQKCGMPFKVKCPKCGKENLLDKSFCSCGFAIGDMPIALNAMKAAKDFLAQNNLRDAENMIRRGLLYWPDNPNALEMQSKLAELRRKITLQECEKHLLNLTAPAKVTACVTPTYSIDLNWTASAFADASLNSRREEISYLVIRKKDALPSSPKDGEALIDTSNTHYEDTKIEYGQVYGYAIFASYSGIPGKHAAASKKIIVTHDIVNPKVTTGENQLQITWEPCGRVIDYVCRRKKGGIPQNFADGEPVPVSAASGGILDTHLVNGQMYGYWIAAVFCGTNGERITTAGVTLSGTPVARPPRLDNVDYTVTAAGLEFSWGPIPGCVVWLFLSSAPFAATGDLCDIKDGIFSGIDKIMDCNQSEGKAAWNGKIVGKVYLTPVVCRNQSALICNAIPIVQIKKISHLKAQRRAGDLEITWQWPEGVEEVCLLYRSDQYPETHDDELAAKVNILRSHYEQEKAHIIRRCGNQAFFCSVYSVVRDAAGALYYSAGQFVCSIGNQSQTIIRYSIINRKQFFLFGKQILQIKIHAVGGGGIPGMVLLKKNNRQPLRREDGIAVMKIAPDSNASEATFPMEENRIEKNVYLKLFLDKREDMQFFTIEHPDAEKMKIE